MSKNSILKLKVAKKFDFEVEIVENQKKSIDFAIFFSKFSKTQKTQSCKKNDEQNEPIAFFSIFEKLRVYTLFIFVSFFSYYKIFFDTELFLKSGCGKKC